MLRASLVYQWQRICMPIQGIHVWSLGQKIPCRKKWPHTPVFFLGKSRAQRSLVNYSPHVLSYSLVSNSVTRFRIFQFVVIHTVKDFSTVNKVDAFLELSCFLCDPTDVAIWCVMVYINNLLLLDVLSVSCSALPSSSSHIFTTVTARLDFWSEIIMLKDVNY